MNMIVQRVHQKYRGRNTTVGVFVGMKQNGTYRCGWSSCKLSAGDTFDMENGVKIALGNMVLNTPTPHFTNMERTLDFQQQYVKFGDRCGRYFKDTVPAA